MKNECTKYAESIRNDLNKLFNGETVEECESLIDYLCENELDVHVDNVENLEDIMAEIEYMSECREEI